MNAAVMFLTFASSVQYTKDPFLKSLYWFLVYSKSIS